MSGLTKKQVYVDRNLSSILGVREGELVSYAEIQKLLHKYIKDNDLKNPARSTVPLAPLPAPSSTGSASSTSMRAQKRCVDCGAEIPSEAAYCDVCGVAQ